MRGENGRERSEGKAITHLEGKLSCVTQDDRRNFTGLGIELLKDREDEDGCLAHA